MAVSRCINGREEMTKNIIIKTSVQKRFDSFMVHGIMCRIQKYFRNSVIRKKRFHPEKSVQESM